MDSALAIIVWLVGLIVAIVWLIFPFRALSLLREIRDELRRANLKADRDTVPVKELPAMRGEDRAAMRNMYGRR